MIMQKIGYLFAFSILFLSACVKDECTTTYTYQGYEAIYKSMTEIQDEIGFVDNRVLENPGKIYYYNNLILISERNEGVHVIDNSDVRKPQSLGFLTIPGNQDISMSDHYIYADTRFNIVVIDIEEVREPRIVTFIENVKDIYYEQRPGGQVLVDFVLTDLVEEVNCSGQPADLFWSRSGVLLVNSSLDAASSAGVPEFNNNGIAGSLSRMALFDDHFYYINEYKMSIFDVTNLEEPRPLNEIYLDWGIETIFPYEDKLFIGANNGMHIFDNADPANPVYLSTFAHARACDPVVVQGDLAYVTLRDGNECTNFVNQLDVVDVSDLLNPQLLASFPMHNPHGLSVRDNILYLCEGDEGLKVFDITDPEVIHEHLLAHVKDYYAYDVISLSPSLLLMIGADGFYQFNTSDPGNPEVLSSIAINH